jgi:hypothetical protein
MRDSAGAYVLWTPAEDARLRDLCEGKTIRGDDAWMVLGEEFPGRSYVSCRQRWLTLRNIAKGVKRVRLDRPRKRNRAMRIMPADRLPLPPPLPEHRTLTAAFFGDPLPGRSALDRRSLHSPSTSSKGDQHASHY